MAVAQMTSDPLHDLVEIKRLRGRPPTGITKEVIKASLDRELAIKAKRYAFQNNESLSGLLSRAVTKMIEELS